MGLFSSKSLTNALTGGLSWGADWAKESIMANSANAKAKRQATTAWNRTMEADNTKYQRTMEDMKAAGLNPILGMSEAGASGVGQATAATTHQAHQTGGLQDAITSAMQIQNQNKLTDAQKNKLEAETAAITAKNPFIPERERKEQAEIAERTRAIKLENDYNDAIKSDRITKFFAEVEQAIVAGRMSKIDWDMLEKYGVTRSEAIKLGGEGLKIIGNLVAAGIGGAQLKGAIKNLSKNRHSAGH